MTFAEFQRFMKNKILYAQVCSWLEKGKYDKNWIYSGNFILPKKIKLRIRGPGFHRRTDSFDYYTAKGRPIWKLIRWTATMGKNKKVYVTRYSPDKDN